MAISSLIMGDLAGSGIQNRIKMNSCSDDAILFNRYRPSTAPGAKYSLNREKKICCRVLVVKQQDYLATYTFIINLESKSNKVRDVVNM